MKKIIIGCVLIVGAFTAVAALGQLTGGPMTGGGMGTVTSVAVTVPAEFSVSGSPVTTSGTIAITEANQSANRCYCGPTTGDAAAPGYRAIVDADVPNNITIDLAATATALAANPADCAANQFANAIAASGALTCAAIADADVPDTITASSYCKLTAGADCAITGDVTITGAAADLTVTNDALGAALGTTPANTQGELLTNTTAAVVGPGVTVQVPPSLTFHGSAWETTTPGNDTWDWRLSVLPATAATSTSDFQWHVSKDGAAYGTRLMYLTQAGSLYASNNIVSSGGAMSANTSVAAYANNIIAYYGTYFGIAGQYALEMTGPANIKGIATTSATNVAVRTGSHYDLTTEGARLHQGMNASVEKWSVDKDGVYWNAYGSGQIVGASTKSVTLVTTCDDDSTYIVKYYVIVQDQAATPASQAAYSATSVYDRIDGTLTQRATSVTELYDGAAAFSVADAPSGNSIVVTVTGTGATTVNVKVYGVEIMKSGSAALGAGVAYPRAN